MNNKSNFRRGSVELLILHLLSQQDYYGYEISTLIREQTRTLGQTRTLEQTRTRIIPVVMSLAMNRLRLI